MNRFKRKYDPDRTWREGDPTPPEYEREFSEFGEGYKAVLVFQFGDSVLCPKNNSPITRQPFALLCGHAAHKLEGKLTQEVSDE
jgi:hypothetical protein